MAKPVTKILEFYNDFFFIKIHLDKVHISKNGTSAEQSKFRPICFRPRIYFLLLFKVNKIKIITQEIFKNKNNISLLLDLIILRNNFFY